MPGHWQHDNGSADQEFVDFVVRSQHQLCRVAYLMCGDWHKAQDIVQNALAKVYVGWGRITDEPGPWPYARRAVINASIDEERRPWRREFVGHTQPDRAVEAPVVMDSPTVDALAALPPRQRAVVVLRYIEDLDVEATAELLGISPGTVKSQAARGLATMRERLSTPGARAARGGAR